MPHLVQLDHDSTAFRLGLLGVDFGEALDPGLHRGRRHAEQLGGAAHRQPAQVQQQRLDLDPQRHATGRRVGEVQPARLAAVALLAAHEAVLDVLLAPAPLAPQRHPLIPSAVPLPTYMGDLCGLETLPAKTYEDGIQRILDGSSGVLFGDMPLLRDAVAHSPASGNLIILDRYFTHQSLALALPRADEDFRLEVDLALSGIYGTDGFRNLLAEWFGTPDEKILTFFRQAALPE